MSSLVAMLMLAAMIAVLVGIVVYIFRHAGQRERMTAGNNTSGSTSGRF